jgi:protein-disulfide isomerase
MVRRPFHPHACQAATYARCAARQGKYWPFEAMLFRNRNQLDEESLRIYARHIGLEMSSLEECVHRSAIQLAISADIQAGLARGLRGTPTFFINGEIVVGIRPIEFWSEKIQAAERTSRPRSHE